MATEPKERTMSDLEEAEDRTKRWRECCERGNHDDHEYWEDSGQQEEDKSRLIDWAMGRLAADRAEAAERAKPIDSEWLSTVMDKEFRGAFSARTKMLGVLFPLRDSVLWVWAIGDVHVATIATRGQLLDLIQALKGGGK